jgi:hypothetical protein
MKMKSIAVLAISGLLAATMSYSVTAMAADDAPGSAVQAPSSNNDDADQADDNNAQDNNGSSANNSDANANNSDDDQARPDTATGDHDYKLF